MEKKTIRVSVAHIHRDLEASGGRFEYTRRRSSKNVLRVTGKLAGVASAAKRRRADALRVATNAAAARFA